MKLKTLTIILSSTLVLPAFAGIKGAVTLTGKAPAPAAIDMKSDPKCAKMAAGAKTDDIVVAGDKLADVFVYVKNAPAGKYQPIQKNVLLDQKNCSYSPKVFGVMVNQNFDILNSDPTLHNVHAFAKRGEFNQAMPKQGQKITKKFKKEEIGVAIKCDVHSWMAAYAHVLPHPFFAVSSKTGEFEIPTDGLKDGTYEVVAWHAKLGEQKGSVTVAGGAGSVKFAMAAK